MQAPSYSEMLRELSHSYYNRHISLEEYRLRRKNILNALDGEHNGAKVPDTIAINNEQESSSYTEQVFNTQDNDKTVELRPS